MFRKLVFILLMGAVVLSLKGFAETVTPDQCAQYIQNALLSSGVDLKRVYPAGDTLWIEKPYASQAAAYQILNIEPMYKLGKLAGLRQICVISYGMGPGGSIAQWCSAI